MDSKYDVVEVTYVTTYVTLSYLRHVDLTKVSCRMRCKEDWPLTAVFERFNENHFFFASRWHSVSILLIK